MSAVCTCNYPKIKENVTGDKFCIKCGYWWKPECGSKDFKPKRKYKLEKGKE
jgi:hypothetical protein